MNQNDISHEIAMMCLQKEKPEDYSPENLMKLYLEFNARAMKAYSDLYPSIYEGRGIRSLS